jgi:uncharacterized protein YfaS (alpha-2-macroglobulin family)
MYANKLKGLLAWMAAFMIQFTYSQQKMNDYTAQWKKTEELEKKGLTQSARTNVMGIYQQAVKDKNDPQQIKACMYLIKYRNMVEEDSRENNIFYVDTLIEQAKAPAKNILQSMQAQMFWQYLQNNRWKFYNRTALAEEKSKDIATWSLEKLHQTIARLYKASLSNDALLKSTRLEGFEAIIQKGESTRQLRPTLFDFLAHRALGYYANDERDVNKPAYRFTIADPQAFASAASFATARFATKDTASLYYKAIGLLQAIIQFHLSDNDPAALLDADLIRLVFMKDKAVMENKESLYEAALRQLQSSYPNNAHAAQASYLLAALYYQRGQTYDAQDNTAPQYEIKRAKELCETVSKQFPKSEGGINCLNLLQSILRPQLNLETEKVNVPGEPFRTLVTYKNIPRLHLRLIKINREAVRKLYEMNFEKLWKELVQLKPQKAWSQALPDPLDFQQHRAEIKVDALDNGLYLLLGSSDPQFATTQNILTKSLIYCSNISAISQENDYYVLHRQTGQPLPNSKVQVWESNYNYSTSRNEDNKAEQYTTDANGHFFIKPTDNYRNIRLQITQGNDELFLDDNLQALINVEKRKNGKGLSSFLFTDRGLYRPGQTVYFKGIIAMRDYDTLQGNVEPNYKTTIELHDANYQKIGSVDVTSNEYGSFNGSFRLPEGLLNGQFSMLDNRTSQRVFFSVEEYKRPKFMVEVLKPKGSYRLNDSVKVTGTALAYAGNKVDGAKVKYRVVRQVRWPVWWDYGYGKRGGGYRPYPYNRSDAQEIASGETVTNAKGEFYVTFKALPDEAVDKKGQPVFRYEVSADVTDLNGETRSGSTSVAVAYQALQLAIDIPDRLPADSLKTLLVKSTNLNDIEENTKAIVSIQQLKSPNRLFRERYWAQPDQFTMSRDEYYGYFPYDIYKNENEVKHYEEGAKVLEKTDSTNQAWALGNTKMAAGWYKITATAKDKYGEEAKAVQYIQLTSANEANSHEAITVTTDKTTAEPGQSIGYTLRTGLKKIWLIHQLHRMYNNKSINYVNIEPGKAFLYTQAVAETDRGGIGMQYAFVHHNRVYDGTENFAVPWSNKELKIDYTTFRDKLLPGAQEKWGIKISGSKGEKLAAELLVSMYDASLDQFKPFGWSGLTSLWRPLAINGNMSGLGFTAESSQELENYQQKNAQYYKQYDELGTDSQWWLNTHFMYTTRHMKMAAPAMAAPQAENAQLMAGAAKEEDAAKKLPERARKNGGYDFQHDMSPDTRNNVVAEKSQASDAPVQVRKNFNETAFFFPDLKTDAEGNISFEFTMPEALTQWKLQLLAHSKELASALSTKTIVTQKQLMVQPNAPRFLREGDRMEFSAKVVNLTDKEVTGQATLELLDAATGKPVDGWFKNMFPAQYFTAPAGQSTAVSFPMEVPANFNSALTWRIVAKAPGVSDGEEAALPVLINRMLVTETMPMNLRKTNSKTFAFDKLLNSNSPTLSHHALTLEYTGNPAWYAVQALPYLMEYPYECAEQTFNRYYANALATHVSNSMPRIKAIFDKWKTADTAALLSNLQKNEELKSALLQETPWVLAAQSESQQKKNIALLFDLVKMGGEMRKAIGKLKEMQSSNGGFVWFKGGPDDRYITQYILTGMGHLRKLNVLDSKAWEQLKPLVDKAIPYLDRKLKEEYDNLLRYKAKLRSNNLSYTAIQYLYMRSFFAEYKTSPDAVKAVDYYKGQTQKFWLTQSKYMQAMIALALHRDKDSKTPAAIIRSLKENAIVKEEIGMYWKEFASGGYYWYQSPIESQALLIEAFGDIDKNTATVDDLKTWLLKNKQTTHWKTTRATAEACYALLLGGSNWLAEEKEVSISLGNTVVKSTDDATEAGTGYFKKTIPGNQVQPAMGNITVTVSNQQPNTGSTSWGAAYWQYFEELDKITAATTPLKLNKKLFKETMGDKGPVLKALNNGDALNVGDKVKVRIELRVDRDMEYVHMKDMRAACMEPVNVLSSYKWQGGLGYYESTKDASTQFFLGWLPRGTYVFEYPLLVTHKGNYSNGVTTIQCMYAPEFSSHSEGIRVNIE